MRMMVMLGEICVSSQGAYRLFEHDRCRSQSLLVAWHSGMIVLDGSMLHVSLCRGFGLSSLKAD